MADATTVGKNTFTWIDLATTDLKAAKAFYAEIFGWNIKDQDAGDAGTYAEAFVGDKVVGGLYELNQEMRDQGIPPHWASYILVENVDEKAKLVTQLGGTLVREPFDVMDHGRMAVALDPGGAAFCLWQAKKHVGAAVFNQPGSLTWNELLTHDTDKARAFYTKLFGWTSQSQDMGGGFIYTSFMNGERPAGGMMAITPEMGGDVPANWMAYIAVDDCDAVVKRAESKGATIFVPPKEIPEVGKFATLQDPQGAVLSVIKMAQPPQD
jgi:predicted enzyme related to lactoylglutathione lyase